MSDLIEAGIDLVMSVLEAIFGERDSKPRKRRRRRRRWRQ